MPKKTERVPSQRQLKAAEMVKVAVNECFKTGKMLSFGFEESSVTVTEAKVSPDMRNAKIFITPFGKLMDEGKKQEIMQLLSEPEVKNFVRKFVANRINFKYSPELVFLIDEALEHATRINDLIRKI